MPLAQRILSTTVLGLLLCTLAVFGIQPAQAAKPTTLTITEASWNGTTLTIKGKGAGGVEIVANNASDPFQDLGSDTPGNNGRYTITNSDASSSTVCRVHVEQFAGGELKLAEAPVTGNAYCDDPPPPNDQPVCTIDSPDADVNIIVGEYVN